MDVSPRADGNLWTSVIPASEPRCLATDFPYTFQISGLAVGAEMPLPGVAPSPVPAGGHDVLIRRRPVLECLEAPSARGAVWELDGSRFLLSLPRVGRFLATAGTTLDFDVQPGSDPADAMPFLMGTGFGALLLQRGGLVLHAASVAADGKAYLFCGRSGIGKSSLVAALCRAGCHFLSDDICAIGLHSDGRPVVWPDGRRLKLFEESIAHLSLNGREMGLVRSGIGKHYVEPPGPESRGAVPVGGVYILRDAKLPGEAGMQRLGMIDGAQMLLGQNYRPALALAMAKSSRQFALTAALLRHAPVFTLTRERDLSKLTETVTQLTAQWSERGSELAC